MHDPRETSPSGRTFTVEYLGNVVGAPPVVYLNVEIDLMKHADRWTRSSAASRSGSAATPARCPTATSAIWDAALYDYDGVYDTESTLDKADRLLHHETLMTHAMLFTGVDVRRRRTPRRWRVENSWGDEKADKGFWTMNDNWFGEYVFEIAVRRDALPAELQAALDAGADRAARLGPDGRPRPLRQGGSAYDWGSGTAPPAATRPKAPTVLRAPARRWVSSRLAVDSTSS